ncbi:MAG: twitching motility protein PilT [Chloroflexi bacterium]|nr:twitching motility protein PilT [Chloroflexota bacterium]MCL5274524.1 twitching motility protein PilT [Chloroflexota bacterium]
MLFDSNIIIYATQPGHAELHRFIVANDPAVSIISYIEVLGYHRLSNTDRQLLKTLFALMDVLPINKEIAEKPSR